MTPPITEARNQMVPSISIPVIGPPSQTAATNSTHRMK